MNPRRAFLIGQLISVLVPISMMVGTHITWMPDRMSKLRMAMKHLGFWGGLGINLAMGHVYSRRLMGQFPGLAWGMLTVGAAFPMLGYLGGKKLGKYLFPDREKPEMQGRYPDNRFKVPVIDKPETDFSPEPETDFPDYSGYYSGGYSSPYYNGSAMSSYYTPYANSGYTGYSNPYGSGYGTGYSGYYGNTSPYAAYSSAYPSGYSPYASAYNAYRTW